MSQGRKRFQTENLSSGFRVLLQSKNAPIGLLFEPFNDRYVKLSLSVSYPFQTIFHLAQCEIKMVCHLNLDCPLDDGKLSGCFEQIQNCSINSCQN